MGRKRWLVLISAVLFLTGTVFAYAASPIKLVVNGSYIDSDVSPEMKEGRVLVPIRWVAEALGTDVRWDQKEQTVHINSEEKASALNEQITLLEQALAAKTAEEAVETWAEAIKNRNGAVQFAMLSPELKAKAKPHYEKIHWSTGMSSPYVSEYHIREVEDAEPNEKTQVFNVEFQMKTSTGNAGLEGAKLHVAQIDGHYYISQVLGGTLGIPNFVPEDLHTDLKEVHDLIAQFELGISEAEVQKRIGNDFTVVSGAKSGEHMWRFDFAGKDGYQFEGTVFDEAEGTEIDSVDMEGLENGSMQMQLFVQWAHDDTVQSYALYYKGDSGKIYNYRLYADGKIQLK